MQDFYDIIIIGGGHAGAEAAWAASRLGCSTALITLDPTKIGQMSCNPAIGGLAKGQMVREIDALGGLMGRAIDATGIQYRMLNRSKGPAVWGPRAQADKYKYAVEVQRLLGTCPNLEIVGGEVMDLVPRDGGFELKIVVASTEAPHGHAALRTEKSICCRAVIITTGTFLRGLMHTGETKTTGGRVGEPAASGLSSCLARLGLELGRLKTGTPPRLRRQTIDFSQFEVQPGDEEPMPFSYLSEYAGNWKPPLMQVNCWIGATNAAVHDMIRGNLHRAPMYSGQIQGTGPRYCPSIEDKIVRFADKQSHHIFLEPEGLDTDEVYCNGISTSLPADVQAEMLKAIPGLDRADVMRWGYAVEYDMVWPTQIDSTLQTKSIPGLFLAGQINGTSGYEEAGAQGMIAGINAAQLMRDDVCDFVLRRDQAYMGVLVDDLVTKPPTEPYRMFTSRAEHRLHLREGNADIRLTALGREIGLVDESRWSGFSDRLTAMETARQWLRTIRIDGIPGEDWLRRGDNDWAGLASHHSAAADIRPDVARQVEIDVKYAGYIARQTRQIDRFAKLESKLIPTSIDYKSVAGLRNEAKQKFTTFTPRSLGQAIRISGITPADVTLLAIHLERRNDRPRIGTNEHE